MIMMRKFAKQLLGLGFGAASQLICFTNIVLAGSIMISNFCGGGQSGPLPQQP